MVTKLWTLVCLLLLASSCAYLKAFKHHLNEGDPEYEAQMKAQKERATRKSRHVASVNSEQSQRGRHPRSPFDSLQNDQIGSLWTDKGQENFYFSKNIKRRTGDIVILRVGSEINDLLESRIERYFTRIAQKEAKRAAASETDSNSTAAVANSSETEKVEMGDLTMRLLQSLPRGSFSVQGEKQIYVRSKPFKVKISGIIKMEDIGPDDVVESARLLDSKVSLTK